MNLKDAIEFCFTYRPQWIGGKSQQTNRINCNHALRILGDVDCSTIKTKHFTQLQQTLLKEGKADGTANRVCAALHTILTELSLNEEIDAVPSYRRLQEPETKRSFFTREEAEMLVARAIELPNDGQELQDSIRFALALGERQGELVDLTWSDVDFEENTLTFPDTKNGTDHVLPIPATILPMLERKYEERIDDKVFYWINGGQLLRRFKRLKRLCGLPKDERLWHSLRHTVATWMVNDGVPIKSIMAVLNHKNIETTLRYAKSTKEAKQSALATIEI